MNSKEKDVISILDLIVKRALRSKKATGTRLFLLKAMIDLGSGWHTTREVLQKLSTYDKSLPRKIDHIFELASHYPELVQTDVSDGLPLKNTHAKIRDNVYSIVARHINGYLILLEEKSSRSE